jgi:Zn-dependent protease with chaperone function
MKKSIFDKLSFLSLFIIIVFLPIFFLPNTGVSVELSKGLLLVGGLTLAVIFWSIARFFDGNIKLPKSSLILSSVLIVITTLLSAFFSKSSQISFFGTMFDVGTFWFIFSGFLLLFVASVVIRDVRMQEADRRNRHDKERI